MLLPFPLLLFLLLFFHNVQPLLVLYNTTPHVNPIRQYDRAKSHSQDSLGTRLLLQNNDQIWQRMPKYKVASYPCSFPRGDEPGNEAHYKERRSQAKVWYCGGKGKTREMAEYMYTGFKWALMVHFKTKANCKPTTSHLPLCALWVPLSSAPRQ